MRSFIQVALALALAYSIWLAPADAAAQRCDIPREARGVWRCENGFVIGPENVIIRLPIPETDPEALYNAGIEAAQREDWRVAIAYFTAAHQRAHLVPRYMYNLGLAHARAGNDVSAVAWFAAYLTAEPNAANRAAVLAQIRSSEGAARAKIDRLWQGVLEAAPRVPVLAPRNEYSDHWWEGRGGAYAAGALAAARAGDWTRASQLLDLALRPEHGSAAPWIRSTFDRDLRVDVHGGSAGIAVAFIDGEEPNEAARQGIEDAAIAAVRQSYSYYPGNFSWAWPSYWGATPPLAALRSGVSPGSDETAALISSGRGRVALERIPPVPNPRPIPDPEEGFMGNMRAERAMWIGEMALLLDDAQTARAAHQASARFARLSAETYEDDSDWYFWTPARLNALLMAEDGRTAAAITHLQVFISSHGYNFARHHDSPFNTYSPDHRWSEMRHYAAGNVANYLASRGRVEEALAVAQQLDSARQIMFLDQLQTRVREGRSRFDANALAARRAAAESAAAGGSELTAQQRARTTDMVLVARNVTGAAYDLDWWLSHTGALQNASEQVEAFANAAEDLSRGLRRVRVGYARAGGAWDQ
jgi:hypothetical protein